MALDSAIGLSLMLHFLVIYLPFLQNAFSTTALDSGDWLFCAIVASSVLWLRELSKLVTRARRRVDASGGHRVDLRRALLNQRGTQLNQHCGDLCRRWAAPF